MRRSSGRSQGQCLLVCVSLEMEWIGLVYRREKQSSEQGASSYVVYVSEGLALGVTTV
jgi:hypothetical protein